MVEAILKGLALGIVLALSVGPIVFIIIKQSITAGRKGGFSFVAGVWLSDFILVFLSNVFTQWVADFLAHKNIIGFGGSGLLVAMGIYYFFFKKVVLKSTEDNHAEQLSTQQFFRLFGSGFLINTLNPGVIIFWLGNASILALTHSLRERIVIFSICLLINMSTDVGKVMMAGKLRKKLTVHNLAIINKISGAILIAFGLYLLYSVLFRRH